MPSVRSRVRPHDEPIASVILLDDRKFTFPSCKATDGAYPRGLDRYPPGRRGYGPACASEAWSWAASSAPSPAVTGRWRSSSCSAWAGSPASSGSSAGLAGRRSRAHPGPAGCPLPKRTLSSGSRSDRRHLRVNQAIPLVLLPVLFALEAAVSVERWAHEMAALLGSSRPGDAAGSGEAAVVQARSPSLANDAGILVAGLGAVLLA